MRATDQQGPVRVLFVDDLAAARELVRMVLSTADYEVTTVGTGREVLRMLETEVFPIVAIDLGLPDIKGGELAGMVRERDPEGNIRLIAITGDQSMAVESVYKRAGFDACVIKPFSPEELIGKVDGLADTD